jgi:3-oxoacyl-[acyl-carrier-protein] synthase-3
MAERIFIEGVGSYLPQRILTNGDLERMVDTSDEWIRTRTGIRERRIAAEGEASSDMGVRAAERALADAALSPGEVGAILLSTVTPDMPFPATACLVQRKLSISGCPCMDLEAGCSGMVYALEVATALLRQGSYEHILVVATDKLSAITDWQDRSTCVLLADGASAFVVGKDAARARAEVLGTHLSADGGGADALCQPAGGSLQGASEETVRGRLHFLKMDGRAVFRYAVRQGPITLERLFQRHGVDASQVRFFIPHQANLRIIEALAEALAVAPERFITTLQHTGNISSGSVGMALDVAMRRGDFTEGDLIACVAFGAGLTAASALLRWVKGPERGNVGP